MTTLEQQCRDILERIGIEGAQSYSSGELVELANILNYKELLEKQLAACQEELKSINRSIDDPRCDLTMTASELITELKQQLAAREAEILRLREALLRVATASLISTATTPSGYCYSVSSYDMFKINEALAATPSDMTALREVIARVVDEMSINYGLATAEPIQEFVSLAKYIRSGEWTPECLK